jgi:hypothetical protein
MRTADFSFLSGAEKVTLMAYKHPREISVVASEILSRLAATILLSLGAALDIAYHTIMLLPTVIYAIGKSIYYCKADFTLPWQHLQRVRNAVGPLLLGSALGLIHPYAGLMISEPTDKHAVMGMLTSNAPPNQGLETPCSPIHSLSIVEDIALKHATVEEKGVKKEIFSPDHIRVIQSAKCFEKSLESLQAQEFIHKITNTTLLVMAAIAQSIRDSVSSDIGREVLVRLSGFLVPILTIVDIAITLLVQTYFLLTGVIRLISGRGPIYTEVTSNPLMHVAFLIQNILKAVGNLVGTLVWMVSPEKGFQVSLAPSHLFFKMQMSIVMLYARIKMYFTKENNLFALPIVFSPGECTALSVPTHTMHKTYLILEKKDGMYNLYWVNRPSIKKITLTPEDTLKQIRSMLDERYPFMDSEKVRAYPVKGKVPDFPNSVEFAKIEPQGGTTNCVVSNLFGMLEAVDKIKGVNEDITKLRYRVFREALIKDYGFYEDNFFPFSDSFSVYDIWQRLKKFPEAAI